MQRNFGFEAKPDVVESHGVVILLLAAIIVILGTLAVAHAEPPMSNWTAWTGSSAVTPSTGCMMASISADHRDVTVDWACVDKAIETEPPHGTLFTMAVVLKAVRDGMAQSK